MLTANEILKRIQLGTIKIDPFNENNLNPNSYDLTLSKYISHYTKNLELDVVKFGVPIPGLIPTDGIVLKPGILYLGCTQEYTESLTCIPMINGRSSLARLGISVHQTGGFGDIGFCGNWTLEITVVQPVKIYPGIKFAQLCWFEPTGIVDKLYEGKYQNSKSTVPIGSKIYNELSIINKGEF